MPKIDSIYAFESREAGRVLAVLAVLPHRAVNLCDWYMCNDTMQSATLLSGRIHASDRPID